MTTQETVQGDPNTKPGVLRDMKIYVTANGNNSMFGVFASTFRLTDNEGTTILTNVDEEAILHSGSTDVGHHAALLEALPRISPVVMSGIDTWLTEERPGSARLVDEIGAPRTLTIITSKGDGIFRAYTHTAEELLATGFKQKSGQLWSNAAWIARVLADAEDLRLAVRCRPAESVQEVATLELTRNEGKRRWSRAQKQLRAKYQ